MELTYKFKTDNLFKIFLLFLPFTQALTINVGFPLKISELVLFGLILISISRDKISSKSILLIRENKSLILFLMLVFISFVCNLFWQYEYTLKKVPNRVSPNVDSFLKLGYIVLAIFTFFISGFFLSKKLSLVKYWVYGAVLASIYSWYLFISTALDLPYLKLFGMEAVPQSLFGIIRCGTFKEGNFFGMFLLLSSVLAFYLKRTRMGIFLMITIITTFSTISLISAFIFLLFQVRKFFLRKKTLLFLLIISPLTIVLFIFIQTTTFYKNNIYAKIMEPSNKMSMRNLSKVDRVLTARIAYKIGVNNPILGVGPYNYGLHYDKYNDFTKYIINNNEWSLNYFKRINKRAIPNNIYFEVWAEYGIVGFCLFVIFLLKILYTAFRNKNDIITGGVIAMLVSFNAFPSFTLLFLWVFLSIPFAIKINQQNNKSDGINY